MVTSTPQIMFRDEYVQEFQLRESLLRDRVTTNAQLKGYQATFLVAGSGGATAVTRGSNGKLPYRNVSKTQKTATLTESFDPQSMTGFDIFSSQGDMKQIMMDSSMEVIYRSMDTKILAALSGATLTQAAGIATLDYVTKAIVTLGTNKALGGGDNGVTAVITPAYAGYLRMIDGFSSSDYVSADKQLYMSDATQSFTWNGVTWIVHPELVGVGTSSAICYMFNRSAIGHAYDSAGITVNAGYNEEEDYSYVLAKVYDGAVLLQNSGVIKMLHDDSALIVT
jgi:hypothetical protein